MNWGPISELFKLPEKEGTFCSRHSNFPENWSCAGDGTYIGLNYVWMSTWWLLSSQQSGYREMTEKFTSYHHYTSDWAIWREKMSYPNAVFMLVLFPVVSCVTEHQAVTRHPVRAPVSSLRGHCCNLHSAPQVHLQPLSNTGIWWGPTASSWKGTRQSAVVTSHIATASNSQSDMKPC